MNLENTIATFCTFKAETLRRCLSGCGAHYRREFFFYKHFMMVGGTLGCAIVVCHP